jgi:hypothetical protein
LLKIFSERFLLKDSILKDSGLAKKSILKDSILKGSIDPRKQLSLGEAAGMTRNNRNMQIIISLSLQTVWSPMTLLSGVSDDRFIFQY